MKKVDLEIETVQIAMYSNIIQSLLSKHSPLSICKSLTFAYLIKDEHYKKDKVYTAHNTQDVVCKALSLISGQFDNYTSNVEYIIKAIHILIKKGVIENKRNILSVKKELCDDLHIYQESAFLSEAIERSKYMSDKQFQKEVIVNV